MKKVFLLVLALGFSASSVAHAFDWFGGRLSIGGGYGRAKPKLPYGYQDTYQDGEMWTAHMKYFLNDAVSVVASYADLEPYARGNRLDSYRFRPIVGSLRYNLFHHLPVSPYLTAGAGYSLNKREAPGIVAQKWGDFTWQGGLGLEFFITEGTTLGAEALYHHFEGNGTDVNSPFRLVSAVGTVNFYFGPGPSHKRSEEALKAEKERADKARADAEAAKAQAVAADLAASQANQQALAAQQGQNTAQAQANAAQAQANAAQTQAAAAQAQLQQAQAEVDQVKQMVASKQISPITFATGSAVLQPSSNGTLDKVAGITKKYPNIKLRVEGHTDSTGDAESNQTLSQKRADAVRDYLVTAGVPADQVMAVGFGETHPVTSNDTTDGRGQNRRVEFLFFLK